MARIQLRDTTIYLQDGLSGSADVDETTELLASTPVSTEVEGVDDTMTPVDEVQRIAQYAIAPVGGTYTLTLNLDGASAITTDPIAFDADEADVQTAINTAVAAASYPSWSPDDITVSNEGSSGDSLVDGYLELTFDGTSVAGANHGQTTIDGSSLLNGTLDALTDIDLTSVSLNTDDTDLVPVGARFTLDGETGSPIHTVTARTPTDSSPTTNIVFTPALTNFVGDGDPASLTFLPQQVEIRIGDGDISWTEAREVLYDLDRDQLDDVRLGPEVPLEVNSSFVFEWAATGTGEAISPVDAIKRINDAAEWVSSDSDQCRPYAIDIVVDHEVPCGTNQDQRFTFEDFRWESLEYSIQDAAITLSGRCNRTDALVERLTIS